MWLIVNIKDFFIKSTGGALILAILCFYPYLAFFQYIDFCRHKNQVEIEQTVCDGFSWDGDNSYYNGIDYLNFSIDMTFKKEEVSTVDVHTLVFKEDQYIGYISTSFKGPSTKEYKKSTVSYFEPETTHTLKFNISHATGTTWEGEELFEELYNGDLEEYTFISNIICVNFVDGTTVGRFALSHEFYYDDEGKIHYYDDED